LPEAERLLATLDPEQREVALALEGPVRVLAGAGTGKTRAITHRIGYGVLSGAYSPTEVLAVTFTTRAAGELRDRLARLGAPGVQARTFHSAALRQARYFWPQVYGAELPQLAPSKLPIVGEAASRLGISTAQDVLRDLASEIEWAKVTNVRPDSYAHLAARAGRQVAGHDLAEVAKLFEVYEEVKQRRSRIDMEDLLLCAAAVLSQEEQVAAAVRRQYHWFVVDEFQDVSPIQTALLDLWLGERRELCVVGDPAQTIYSFAGASSGPLLEFPRQHPGTTTITLSRNYRSTPQILAAANAVMAARRRGSAVQLRPTRPAGTAVTFSGHSDEVSEAAAVARAISRLVDAGVPAADVAVLFRVNAQSEAYEEALAAASVPYVVRGADRFFDRPEVKQAITLLRGAGRSGDHAGSGLVETVSAVFSSMGWSASPPAGRGRARDQWESLRALVLLTEELASADTALDLGGLVATLQARADAQHAPVADGVTLATLHAAKGLEWPHVFLVGMHEGTMPITYARDDAAIEEECRLLYVGMTRARDGLALSWAAARTPGGRGSREASRFLEPLVDPQSRASGVRSAAGRGSSRRTMQSCRVCGRPLIDPRERKLGRCADCPSSYDEDLFEALREWRRGRASAEKVPAYCVFTDATLTALAEVRPSDVTELVGVPGVGKAKIDKYGADILQLCGSNHPAVEAFEGRSATSSKKLR
jgi:DNA helicase-2/ATP-dependent DNA helicase PcrA